MQSITFAPASFTNRGADCILPLLLGTLTRGEYLLLVDVSANQYESTRAVRFSVQ